MLENHIVTDAMGGDILNVTVAAWSVPQISEWML
jgi:hypothetical protein